MRCISVSMSPSVRSMRDICSDTQSVGSTQRLGSPDSGRPAREAACGASRQSSCGNRGSGRPPTAAAGDRASARDRPVPDRATVPPAPDDRRPRAPGSGRATAADGRGCCSSRLQAAEIADRCCASRACRADRSGGSRWRPPARDRAADLGRGAERAVVHVAAGAAGDLRDLRRASAGASRGRRTCVMRAKATWSTSMLRPMPMASVATR